MNLSATDLATLRDVLIKIQAVPATASDGDVAAAHSAMLQSPNASEYKAQLIAGGVSPAAMGTNWLMWLGLAGGAVALYFIWQHYQKPKQVSAHDYPEPEPSERIRRVSRVLKQSMGCCEPKRLGRRKSRMGRFSDGPGEKYEFEPEIRLEGYRRGKRKGKR